MSKNLDYRHHYVARVIRDRHTGTVMLQLLDLDGVLDLNNGDECVTLATAVSLDGGRWAAGIAAPTRGDADLLDEVRALMAERARPDVFMDESTFLGRLHDLLDRPPIEAYDNGLLDGMRMQRERDA